MIRALLRILHFLLCFIITARKVIGTRCRRLKNGSRYAAMSMAHYFSKELVLRELNSRLTKESLHTAIVINREQPDAEPTMAECLKVAEVSSWLIQTGTRQVTVFDRQGKFGDDKYIIAKELKRLLQLASDFAPIDGEKTTVAIVNNNGEQPVIECKSDKAINITISNDRVEERLRVTFISQKENLESMLKAVEIRGIEKACSGTILTEGKEKLKELEKQNYICVLNPTKSVVQMQSQLECYQGVIRSNDKKEIPLNPQVILSFNSRYGILQLPGFPMLMKEIAEIFECGELLGFQCIDFITGIERYSSIQQRWGL